MKQEKITLIYEDCDGDERSASFKPKEAMFAPDVVDWMGDVFEAFGFSAVSVRISEERANSQYVQLDQRMQRLLDGEDTDKDTLAAIRTLVSEMTDCHGRGGLGLFATSGQKEMLHFLLDMEATE